METKDHNFDGKEDRNYHQKPFDDNSDPLPQIDKQSADAAATTVPESNKAISESNETDENESEGFNSQLPY